MGLNRQRRAMAVAIVTLGCWSMPATAQRPPPPPAGTRIQDEDALRRARATAAAAQWKKAAEVKQKLAEWRSQPDDEISVELAEHTISTSHSPYITVQVGKAPAKTLKFKVTASFTLNAFVLTLQNGEVREIRSGTCEAEGKLEGLGLLLAEKRLSPLAFPGRIPVGATPLT